MNISHLFNSMLDVGRSMFDVHLFNSMFDVHLFN